MSQIASCNAHSLGKKENPLKLARRDPPVEEIAGLFVLLAANSLRQKIIQRKTVPPPPPADARAFPIPPLPGTAASRKEKADA